MKPFTIILGVVAAASVAQAQDTIVGCRPAPDLGGTTMQDVITFLERNDRAGMAPALKYGFWDGRVQQCCGFGPPDECGSVFTFDYGNHPFDSANYEFETAPGNGKWIQCFKANGLVCN